MKPSSTISALALLLLALMVCVEMYPVPNIDDSVESKKMFEWEHNQDQYEAKPKHHHHFNKQINQHMQVHKLAPDQSNITCNDGSQIGYYMRLNNHSKNWIIYLQGGGFCGSVESCQLRWQWTPHLMSSKSWPKTKTGK